jgi:hypothetical protein
VSRQEEIEKALARPCIADNSLLGNFVHAGVAGLLYDLLKGPVHLSPSILDPFEAKEDLQAWKSLAPSSEFLGQIRRSLELEEQSARHNQALAELAHYQRIVPRILDFTKRLGERWEPVQPTSEELTWAAYLSDRIVREDVRARCPDLNGRIELDAGEAEAVAVAVNREWTILVDDQAAVNLLKCLYPRTRVIRTCELLVHAACSGYIACPDASYLFNSVIVEELGFHAKRAGKRLYLRCSPTRCLWEDGRGA